MIVGHLIFLTFDIYSKLEVGSVDEYGLVEGGKGFVIIWGDEVEVGPVFILKN